MAHSHLVTQNHYHAVNKLTMGIEFSTVAQQAQNADENAY